MLLALAAPPRFVSLGQLSFYGDEETTAMPSRAFAEGRGPVFPTGMEYHRALPYTWAAGALVRIFGPEEEWVYRLPAAVAGALSVPMVFLLGRMLAGAGPAAIAALLLAFSEWHLVLSRQARMYAPFLLAYLLAAYFLWRWASEGRRSDLVLGSVTFGLTMSLHSLGLAAVQFVAIPLVLAGPAAIPPFAAAAFVVVATLAGGAFMRYVVSAPYSPWMNAPLPPWAGEASSALADGMAVPVAVTVVGLLAGAGLGLAAGLRSSRPAVTGPAPGGHMSQWRLGFVLAAVLAGVAAGGGAVYGTLLAAWVALVIHPGSPIAIVRAASRLWVSLAGLVLLWVAFTFVRLGDPVASARELLSLPYPYPLALARQSPVIVLAFGLVALRLALTPSRAKDAGIRGAALATVLPLAVVGMAQSATATRYVVMTHPFMLLVVGWGTWQCFMWLSRRFPKPLPRSAVGAAVAVFAVSGVFVAHGIPYALPFMDMTHRDRLDQAVHKFPFRPDHEAAGLYVSAMRKQGDVVIAEDPLQQFWYAGGPIDYWFRNPRDAWHFLHESEDGGLSDIYVGSTPILDIAEMDRIVDEARGRVWFITSGETAPSRNWYLSDEQRIWLEALQRNREPEFLARDGVTAVYCLNCSAAGTPQAPTGSTP
jgi:hypothetical protein